MKWTEFQIRDICDIVSGGTPNTADESLWHGKIPWITPADLSHYTNRYISYGERNISETGLKKSAAKLLPRNTVLLTSRAPIGYVKIAGTTLTTNQGFKNLICDPEKANYLFLYYWLSVNVETLRNYASGATFPELSAQTLGKIKITIPDLPTQEKIASILSAYDDAIENNNKRIKILEKMAENLYREWFVRMRFPGHETAEYENGLPKGWSVKRLKDFGRIETGKTPSTERVEFYLGGHIPFIKTPDMNGNFFTLDTEEKLTIQGSNSQRKKLIPKHSIMVSCIGSGGVVSVNSFASHTNQQINTLILKDMIFLEYMFFVCKYLKSKILMYGSTGSTMTNLSKGKFEKLKVICPDQNTLLMYKNCCKDIFKAIENCSMLNMKLRLMRDILLLRLMVKNRGGNI